MADDDQLRLRSAIDAVLRGDDVEIEVRLTAAARPGLRLCDIALRPLTDGEGAVTGAIACVTDTTESANMRAELEWRATTDMLTGCSNRAVALQRLDEALDDVSQGAAVIFLDLDRSK